VLFVMWGGGGVWSRLVIYTEFCPSIGKAAINIAAVLHLCMMLCFHRLNSGNDCRQAGGEKHVGAT